MKANHPLTILFDANSLMVSRTGVGHYTARLVESIATTYPSEVRLIGYYYNFLGRKHKPLSPVAPNIRYVSILFVPGPIVNLLRRFGIEIPVELLTLKRADFILYPNFLSQPSIFRTPSAPVIHDLVYLDFPEYGSAKNVKDLTKFVPHTLQRASFVMTVSEVSKQRIIEAYDVPAEQILTTFIPPEPPVILSESHKNELLKQHGITKPYLLFIGTIEPRKNIVALLDAYTLLPEKLRKTHSFVLAGKIDWKFQETKARMEKLQAEGFDVKFLGYIDDETKNALFQDARLFVMASHYEGFGMQITDSLNNGLPMAVSDIPIFHEVGGDAVSYFDHNHPQAIADTISKCLVTTPNPQSLRAYIAKLPSWHDVSVSVVERIKDELNKRGKT